MPAMKIRPIPPGIRIAELQLYGCQFRLQAANALFSSCEFTGELLAAVLAHGGSSGSGCRRRTLLFRASRLLHTASLQPFFECAQAVKGVPSLTFNVEKVRRELLRQVS